MGVVPNAFCLRNKLIMFGTDFGVLEVMTEAMKSSINGCNRVIPGLPHKKPPLLVHFTDAIHALNFWASQNDGMALPYCSYLAKT